MKSFFVLLHKSAGRAVRMTACKSVSVSACILVCVLTGVSLSSCKERGKAGNPAEEIPPVETPAMTTPLEEIVEKAGAGDAESQRLIGYFCENGIRGYEKDFAAAFGWFLKAAEQGNVSAMNSVAAYYSSGTGVEENKDKALEWWSRAADSGSAEALTSIGACHYLAMGVKQNTALAVSYWRKAAALGDALAMYNIGFCMEIGVGAVRHLDSAKYFYSKSAALGCRLAKDRLVELSPSGIKKTSE